MASKACCTCWMCCFGTCAALHCGRCNGCQALPHHRLDAISKQACMGLLPLQTDSMICAGGQWTVVTKSAKPPTSREEVYDFVVLATGSFLIPRIPHISVGPFLASWCCAACFSTAKSPTHQYAISWPCCNFYKNGSRMLWQVMSNCSAATMVCTDGLQEFAAWLEETEHAVLSCLL